MLRICFFLPSMNIGGVENVFITYANELAERGYNIHFVLCKKEGKLLPLISEKVRIDSLGGIKLRQSLLPLRKYLKTIKPDVLITGGDFPNLMCIIATRFFKDRPKVIISKHNYRNIETKELGPWARLDMLLQSFLYPKADKIVAVSRGIDCYLKDEMLIAAKDIVQINNPIDVKHILLEGEEKTNVDLPANYIVFVGRLGKVKNIPLLLRAFNLIGDDSLHLVIVGDGSERSNLENYCKTLSSSERVHFIGPITNPMPIIKRAKTLALCSHSEAYPTVLLEAMVFNVPVVATPTTGALEILTNVDGGYITRSFDDEEELKTSLIKAVHHNFSNMSAYAAKNDKNIIVDKLEKVIKGLVSE